MVDTLEFTDAASALRVSVEVCPLSTVLLEFLNMVQFLGTFSAHFSWQLYWQSKQRRPVCTGPHNTFVHKSQWMGVVKLERSKRCGWEKTCADSRSAAPDNFPRNSTSNVDRLCCWRPWCRTSWVLNEACRWKQKTFITEKMKKIKHEQSRTQYSEAQACPKGFSTFAANVLIQSPIDGFLPKVGWKHPGWISQHCRNWNRRWIWVTLQREGNCLPGDDGEPSRDAAAVSSFRLFILLVIHLQDF